MGERVKKINAVIGKELSGIIAQEVDFKPGVFVTISKVDTTDDMRYTRVFVRIFPLQDIDYGLKTLEHEKKMLQKKLYQKMPMKILPKISFKHDKTGDEVDEIERLLREDR